MDILKIDKNFVQEKVTTEGGVKLYALPSAPFEPYGVFYDEKEEQYLRLPRAVADSINDGVRVLNHNTAGGRVRFITDSPYIAPCAPSCKRVGLCLICPRRVRTALRCT